MDSDACALEFPHLPCLNASHLASTIVKSSNLITVHSPAAGIEKKNVDFTIIANSEVPVFSSESESCRANISLLNDRNSGSFLLENSSMNNLITDKRARKEPMVIQELASEDDLSQNIPCSSIAVNPGEDVGSLGFSTHGEKLVFENASITKRSTVNGSKKSMKKAKQGFVKMDWQGQKLAEQIMQIMLLVFAVISFVAGYVLGSFQMMILVYAGGVTLTTLITVPNWPFFNRNPLNWLDPSEAEKHPKPQVAVSSKKKATKK
ncbi:hypothetical protein REPUB_Repub01dG0072300 [Reevesia pubescens]